MLPNPLTVFAVSSPNATWGDFRNYGVTGQVAGTDYKSVKTIVFNDQGEICAYCEVKTPHTSPHKQRLEHFHSKSDTTNPTMNWALEWSNIIGVCIGGNDANTELHPLPENLSCDSHKDHILTDAQKNHCEGLYLNPLGVVAFPCLFAFNKATGEMQPDVDNCRQVRIEPNKYATTEELVTETIRILNLNCYRLKDDRLEVLKIYNQEIAKARKSNNTQIFTELSVRWFNNRWPSFFTTRRVLLGKHAEAYLQHISYNG